MLRLFDRLLPKELLCSGPDTRRRARLVVGFTLALVFWSPVFAAIYSWLDAPGLSAAILIAGACVMSVPGVLALTRSIPCAGNLLTLNLFWILIWISFQTDGVRSPAMGWLVAVPMLGTLLMGYRAGTLWLAATLASLAALFASDCPVWPHSQGLDPEKLRALELSGLVGITLVVFSLTLIYEKVKDQAVVGLLAADRVKSEFLANMSHELRTPLTAILGYTDLLLAEADTSPARTDSISNLRKIRRNGEHLLEVINDILDLSKIEAGKLHVERVDVSPVKLLDEVVALMRVRVDAGNLALSVEYEPSVPEVVRTDPTRLRQILFNLVGNAIKFTPAGSVRIVVRMAGAAGHQRLQIDVIDTGIGIADDHRGRLFEPFTQADASSSRTFGGTGLGLAISRRLARMLGGDISVESAVGTGSRFRVEVATGTGGSVCVSNHKPPQPAVRKTRDSVPASSRTLEGPLAANPSEAAPSEDALKGIRVLLAEDGPDNRHLIAFVLGKAGIDVTLAENGRVAVDVAQAALDEGQPFDVILMDMQMPELDGYAATRELRRRGYTLPIVALTAHAMADDRRKCLAAGCDDYATKPIQRAALLGVVEKFARQTVMACEAI